MWLLQPHLKGAGTRDNYQLTLLWNVFLEGWTMIVMCLETPPLLYWKIWVRTVQLIQTTVHAFMLCYSVLSWFVAPYSTYQFRVQAVTIVGTGNFSEAQSFSTPESGVCATLLKQSLCSRRHSNSVLWCAMTFSWFTAPTEPRNLTVMYINSTALYITWQPPLCHYGIITGYTVRTAINSQAKLKNLSNIPCNRLNMLLLLVMGWKARLQTWRQKLPSWLSLAWCPTHNTMWQSMHLIMQLWEKRQ